MKTWILKDVETSEIHEFIQMLDVERFLGMSRTYVRKCMKNGNTVHDWENRKRYEIMTLKSQECRTRHYGWKPQLCVDCANFAFGCEWSERFEPVPGWTATPTLLDNGSERVVRSYCITECPKFVRG